jgi:hypothetical protein
MVPDLVTVTLPRCSTTGVGSVGSDGLLILSPVIPKGDAEGFTGTAVSDESPCSTSRSAGPGGIKSDGGFPIPSDFATVLESIFDALRTRRSECSTRGGGRVGSDGFLILSTVTLEEGTAGSNKSPCSTSQRGNRSGGGRGERVGFLLIPSPVTLEEGDAGGLTETAVSDELPCSTSRLASPGGKEWRWMRTWISDPFTCHRVRVRLARQGRDSDRSETNGLNALRTTFFLSSRTTEIRATG